MEGIEANFNPATSLQANDLVFLTSAVHIEELSLSVSLVKAHVAIKGFKLSGSTFSMTQKDLPSSPTSSPNLRGTLSSPITIRLAEADIPYTAPVSMYNLDVHDAVIVIRDADYQTPDGGKANLPLVQLSLAKLSDDSIVAGFETNSGTYHAPLAKPDSGTIDADIRHIKLSIDGPRKSLKGRLDLGVGVVNVGGVMAWQPLQDCCGDIGDANAANPSFNVPLQVSAQIPGL